jgi:hypothetical protein
MQLVLCIGGEVHKIDLSEELRIDNLEADRSEVAAKIAHWGAVLAAAEEVVEKLEADFDHWNGKSIDICLKAEEKAAEWKVKAAVYAQDAFLKQKHAIATARSVANKVKAVYNGYSRKHDLLRAMTGREGPEGRSANDLGRSASPSPSGPDPRLKAFRQTRVSQTEG